MNTSNIAKIAAALVKAQAEMTTAVKDSKNPFFKSQYADLNSVREACMPALNKHGIAVLQPTVVVDGKNYVQTLLLHESGESLTSLTEIKVSKLNDAQAEGSGISYARRYGLQSFVNIGASDDDGEKSMGRENTQQKPAYVTKTAATKATETSAAVQNGTMASGTLDSPPAVGSATASSFKKAAKPAVAPTTTQVVPATSNEDWG